MQRSARLGAFYILLAVSGYSLLPIWVKNAQAAGLASPDIALWRFVFAAPLMWSLVMLRGRQTASGTPVNSPEKRRLPRLRLVAMGLMLVMAALSAFWGFERLPAGTYVVLFYTYPAMVAALSLLLGERLSLVGWIALALTTLGVFLCVPDFRAGLGSNNLEGVLLAMFNALVVAVFYIISGRLLRGHTALATATAYTLSGALLGLLVVTLVRGGAQAPPTAEIWLSLAALAAFSTVLPVFSLTTGIQLLGAAQAAIIGTIEPVLTAVFALIFLREPIEPSLVIGGAVILFSVLLLQMQDRLKVPTFGKSST
jgi:drug/metabolite transporter (DMT)-like permease